MNKHNNRKKSRYPKYNKYVINDVNPILGIYIYIYRIFQDFDIIIYSCSFT